MGLSLNLSNSGMNPVTRLPREIHYLFIHCVIKDSLDTSMEYHWIFNGKRSITRENKYAIRTEELSSNQDYDGSVSIRNEEKPDHLNVVKRFKFYVRED